jgi:predicted TIM-barrel fold metal-dependent hydrolase
LGDESSAKNRDGITIEYRKIGEKKFGELKISQWRWSMVNGNIVIDMQHHFIPSEAFKFIGKTPEHDFTIGLKKYRKAYETIGDVDTHLEYMDTAGIDIAILSMGPYTSNGYNFCKTCNDGYSEAIRQYPDRFKGMIQVYPYDDDKNEDEIRRGVEELGLWGIALVSSYGEMTIDSNLINPLYEMALKYDMPVFIHPPVRIGLWGGERYNLSLTAAREYDIAKSFVEIFYGVLPRFPELKVIISHLGGGLTSLKGRLLAWHRPDNFPIPQEDRDYGRSIHEAKELGLFDDFESRIKNVLFDSAGYGGWLPVIKSAFETLGPDHICFGTDYPYELSKPTYTRKIIDDISQLDTPKDDKRKFLGENLRRVFS